MASFNVHDELVDTIQDVADESDLKLNLGSGGTATPGWICIDRSPNIWLSRYPSLKQVLRRLGVLSEGHMAQWDSEVVRGDIRRLPFADATVDAVYSSHVLEHIYYDDARQVIKEVRRVLKPGGIFRLALPDATANARELLEAEAAGDLRAGERYNYQLLAHPSSRVAGVKAVVRLAGGHTHLWQPTPKLLEYLLGEVGFIDVRICSFRVGRLPDVQSIETRPEGFHIEATAP